MRLEQLQYLIDIEQTRSFTHTAERFFVTQQTVSASIKNLESELGGTLINRNSSGLSFTPAGKIALNFARQVLIELEETKTIIKNFIDMESLNTEVYTFKIWSSSALNNIITPKLVDIIDTKKLPYNINVIEHTPDDIFYDLSKDTSSCDFAYISINKDYLIKKDSESQYNEIRCKVLFRDRLVACMNINHPYTKWDALDAEQISTMKRTFYNFIPIREYESTAYSESVICSNDIEFHKEMLKKNNLFVLMPRISFLHSFCNKKTTARPLKIENQPEIIHGILYNCKDEHRIFPVTNLIDEILRSSVIID